MSLKWKELETVLEELRPLVEGSVVQKIAQSELLASGASFCFHGFGAKGPWRLWASLFSDQCCVCLLPEELKPDSAKEPSTFVMVLRKHLLGKRVSRVEQVPHERLFFLHFESGHALLFELIPKKGNLILMESWSSEKKSGKCLGSFGQVSLGAGALYSLPPPPQAAPDQCRDFGGGERALPYAYSRAVAHHYWNALGDKAFSSYKRAWRQALKSMLKKVRTARENAQSDLKEAEEAELYQRRGQAMVANLYKIGPKKYPREKNIRLDGVDIVLDPAKTYADNAESFFKKAKKFSRAVSELAGRVEELEAKEKSLIALGEKLEEAGDDEELESLSKDFRIFGIPVPEKEMPEEKEPGAKPYLEVKSSDGFTIYCGRNQEENRKVTFQEAKGNDLWLHVKGLPGAHVVVKSQKNKTVPLSTLLEAAQLALYHSKIRKGKRAEVDYTYRKYVRAIKGTFAEVTYTGNKTLYLEADPEALKKIMKSV